MNVTSSGNRVFVKMRSLGWAQIWYDWCPFKKEIWTQSHTERPCEDTHMGRPPYTVYSKYTVTYPVH